MRFQETQSGFHGNPKESTLKGKVEDGEEMKGAGLIMGRTEQFFFLNMQFSQTNKWKLYMSLPNHKYEKQPRTRVPRS